MSGGNTDNVTVGSVGLYTLTVTDNITNCSSTQVVNLITDSVVALFSANPLTGVAPLLVNFTNQSVSSNTANTTYSWMFGDGSANSTQTNPTYVFVNNGTYNVTLTVTDSDGSTSSLSQNHQILHEYTQ